MKFFILGIYLLASVGFAQANRMAEFKTWMKDQNIQTMEEFISQLPDDLLTNFTLMHKSASLHGSSYENPRAILFGKKADWIVTFNGNSSQAAGNMIEMMFYEADKHSYSFHEVDFSGSTPMIHENPSKCLACHGTNPRPIWDHYNAWPGAYGDVDDRYSVQEYAYLQSFIELAPTHPRYKYLKKLREGYSLSRPEINNGMTERSRVNRNRDMNIVIYQQKIRDIAFEMVKHPHYLKIRPLLFYFLSKCYVPTDRVYYGDGPISKSYQASIDSFINGVKAGRRPSLSYPIAPEAFLDYLFSRLQIDTQSWYLNTRDLSTYKSMRDGTDRLHESWLNYLLEFDPELKDQFIFQNMDYQIALVKLAVPKNQETSCQDFSTQLREGVSLLGVPLPEVNTTQMTMRGERVCRDGKCQTIFRVLPAVCQKCHTQDINGITEKMIYLPFHEFPELVGAGNKELPQKMYQYITAGKMPMRTPNDSKEYKRYLDNDYPKLKKYLEELLKKASRP